MGVRLSEKHGVNPAIPKCLYCLQDKNEPLLLGKLPNDAEAPRGRVWDCEPCDECQGYMEQGIRCGRITEGENFLKCSCGKETRRRKGSHEKQWALAQKRFRNKHRRQRAGMAN